jgi:hypothetical protein
MVGRTRAGSSPPFVRSTLWFCREQIEDSRPFLGIRLEERSHALDLIAAVIAVQTSNYQTTFLITTATDYESLRHHPADVVEAYQWSFTMFLQQRHYSRVARIVSETLDQLVP